MGRADPKNQMFFAGEKKVYQMEEHNFLKPVNLVKGIITRSLICHRVKKMSFLCFLTESGISQHSFM